MIDLNSHYHSLSGGRYFGGEAKMDQLLDAAAREFDVKKQQQMVNDFQRLEGEKHYQPRMAVATASVCLRRRYATRASGRATACASG